MLDGFARVLAVLVLIAAVALPSFLTERPVWVVCAAIGVLLLAAFAEGTYRVWHGTKSRPSEAATGSKSTLADRLEGLTREYILLKREVPSPSVEPLASETNEAFNELTRRVSSELRRNAPEFMDEWKIHMPGLPSPVPIEDSEAMCKMFEFAAGQCRTIAAKWRSQQ